MCHQCGLTANGQCTFPEFLAGRLRQSATITREAGASGQMLRIEDKVELGFEHGSHVQPIARVENCVMNDPNP